MSNIIAYRQAKIRKLPLPSISAFVEPNYRKRDALQALANKFKNQPHGEGT